MPHNSKGAETQRKDQHSLEDPADLLLWSTQGKRCVCVRVCVRVLVCVCVLWICWNIVHILLCV